jgi:cyclophilin family peptidyl-prolyl cis-trans isomerase
MKRQSRKRNQNRFDFARLEARQLLAVDLGAANLVDNGDFSNFPSGADRPFFSQDDVLGWNAANDADGQQLALFTFQTDDGTALKLDSTNQHRDFVFQDIETITGDDYVLSFDLRGQSPNNGAAIIENVEVFWADELVGTFESSAQWQTHTIVLVGAEGTEGSRLEFREQVSVDDPNGDGLGVLIDNVNVVAATQETLTNGSFETATGDGPFFANGTVPSWFALDRGSRPDLIQLQSTGDNSNIDATEGTRFLNLDTTDSNVDHVFTDIATTEGETYFVVFNVQADGTGDVDNDEVRVRWKTPTSDIATDQWVATVTPNNQWQTYGIVVNGLGDLSRLEFRESSINPGDGSGALIDDVRIYSVDAVVNDLVVDANGAGDGTPSSTTLAQGAESVLVAPSLDLSHASGTNLNSATITIAESAALSQDELSVTVGDSGITQDYNSSTGVLTLTGVASVSQWQDVLRSLRYTNTAAGTSTTPTVGNRQLSIVVTDDSIIEDNRSSSPVIADVNVVLNQLAISAIAPQSVEAGSPLWVTFDIDNPADVALQLTGDSADSSLLTPRFETGESFRISIESPDATTNGQSTPLSGDLTFQLFENIFGTTSRAVERVRALAASDFYDNTIFHRIASNFVIQGGDPEGTGRGGSDLGDFDDQFSTLLQHNRSGLLSYAKSLDDTNDSQFFITDEPSRSLRALDAQHTIFGVITSGEELRAAIQDVDTITDPNNPGNSEFPAGEVRITNAELFQDNRRGAVLLVAPEGVTGETTLTITARDANGNETTQDITVNIVAPDASDFTTNMNPFLNDIPGLAGIHEVTSTFQLTSQDNEGDSVRYLDFGAIQQLNAGLSFQNQIRIPPVGDLAFENQPGFDTFDYSVDETTGLLTYTPGSSADSPDSIDIVVAVAPGTGTIFGGNVDLQLVTVNIDSIVG